MKKGWEIKKLREVAAIEYGYTKNANIQPVGPHFLRITDIQDDTVNWNIVPFCEIKPEIISKFMLVSGDIVFARTGATTGKSFLVINPPKAVFASYLIRLRMHNTNLLLPEFMYLFFQSENYWQSIKTGSIGSTQGGFNATKLGELTIPLPPLTEQQRIVQILDEAFKDIAIARANTEKNIQNAKELFDSYLNAVFTKKGDGWEEKRLGDCVENISTGPFGSLLHKSDYEEGGIPLVNPINIEGNRIIPNIQKTIGRETAQRLAKYVLLENDIVIGRRGEIGRCAIVTKEQSGWLCGTGCFIIRPSHMANPYYLTHLLRSRSYRLILEGVSARATMPSISNDDLTNLVVRLPSIKQQLQTLAMMDTLSVETQRITSIYQNKLFALDELKKSLLHQAFRGEL